MPIVSENLLRLRSLTAIALVALLAGFAGACAVQPTAPLTPTQQELQQCQQDLHLLQNAIAAAGAGDAQYIPVADFPTYRSNRFWSSFASDTLDAGQQQAWRRQLHELGMGSLKIEWQNLPPTERAYWGTTGTSAQGDFFSRCSEPLWQASLQRPLHPAQLDIPDSYSDLQRFFGLYALTRHGAIPSIRAYQQEMRERMDSGGNFQPGRSILYEPAPAPLPADSGPFPQDALGVPRLSPRQLQALLQFHAPRLQVEQQSGADLIGKAAWLNRQRAVLTQQPVLYAYPSWVRSQQGVLLQLNYTAWFTARPRPSALDWYGGMLDGLMWRVTLKPDGDVLFYDSIHSCGCYHSLHLPQNAALDIAPGGDEPLLVFASELSPRHANPVLLVEAGTHYLLQVKAAPVASGSTRPYTIAPYDDLRSLPVTSALAIAEGARRNWFDPDGLIADSARFERFFLWPLGVPSAGAMRQQGHHAIAFAGRRHFDAAWLEDLVGQSLLGQHLLGQHLLGQPVLGQSVPKQP